MRRIKVLFILANPDQTRPIDPDTEFREVWQAIRAAEHRDALELPTPLLAARWADVIEAVDNHKPVVIHISTHGGETELQFVGADGQGPVIVSAHQLRELFEPRKTRVRLVLLNACSSASMARELAAVIGCAIGMDRPITDPDATSFARIFYGQIAAGASVRGAFERGCLAITGQGANRDMMLKAKVSDSPAFLGPIAHLFSAESAPADLILVELGPSDPLFHVPFPRNPFFAGRDDDLHRLHELLAGRARGPVGIRRLGLTGMGGIGKTQLAVEYAYRFVRDHPQGVYWVNAAPSVEAGLAALGTLLGASVDASRDAQIAAAFDALSALPDSLLVLDNLEDPAVLSRPVAPARVLASLPGQLLFTTRRTHLADLAKLEVGILPDPAALSLLLRHPNRHPIRDDSDHPEYLEALTVCRRLGWLPLALELGGAFLGRQPSVTLAQYRATLEKHGCLTVIDKGDDPRIANLSRVHKEAVKATLCSQWESLTQDDDRLLLRIAAQLHEAAAIPISRLALLAGISAEKEMDIFPSPIELAIARLTDASLVEPFEHNDIRLHPLVREFAVDQTPDAEAGSFRLACAARVASAYETYTVLEDQGRTRGIDAIQEDLLVTLKLVQSTDGDTGTRLQGILRLVQREAHHLRGWGPADQPALFPQAIFYRASLLGLASLKEDARSRLAGLAQPHALLLWRASRESPELVRTLTGHENWVNALAALDTHRVVSASNDRTLKVWDLDSGQALLSLAGHSGGVNAVAVLDQRRVVSASGDRTLKVWDLDSGQALLTLAGHGGGVNAVAVLDQRRVVSGSGDRTLKVWDLDTGHALLTLAGHGGGVNAVAMLDQRRVVSASDDRTLKVWDLDSEHPVQSLAGHGGRVSAVAVLDQRRIVSASDDGILGAWDLDSGRPVMTLKGHRGGVYAVAVLDEHRLVSGSYDRTLRVWDLDSGREVMTLEGHGGWIAALVAIHERRVVSASDDGTLKVWDLHSGHLAQSLEGHRDWVKAVAVLEERRVVSASDDGTLKVWDLDSGRSLLTLKGHGGGARTVAVLDKNRLVSGSDDGTLKVWDLDRQHAMMTLSGHVNWVNAVAVLDEGRVVSASYDGTLKVWGLDSGDAVLTLRGHGNRVITVAALDQRRVVSGSDDGVLKVWDVDKGHLLQSLEGHGARVSAVAALDGHRVISGSYDRTLKVWDLDSGRAVTTLVGHAGRVNAVAVLDARRVLSGSDDQTLRAWDLETGRCLATVPLDGILTCLAVTSDGTTVLTGDRAGTVYALRLVLGA